MDPSGNTIVLRIIIIVILLALSAYFSSAETALTMSESRSVCVPLLTTETRRRPVF